MMHQKSNAPSEAELLMFIEIHTGVSLKVGDSVILLKTDGRKQVIEAFVSKSLITCKEDHERWWDERKTIEGGRIEAIAFGQYYYGPEIQLNGNWFPLLAIKSINGNIIDYEDLQARKQSRNPNS
jgi:hypothetical protein